MFLSSQCLSAPGRAVVCTKLVLLSLVMRSWPWLPIMRPLCVPAWSEAALGWPGAEPMLRCATLTCDPWPPQVPARSVFILITRVMGLMD